MKVFLLTIPILVLLVKPSDAISCYSCSSKYCSSVLLYSYGSSTTCSSCTTSTDYSNNLISTVTRSCSYSSCFSYIPSNTVDSGYGTISECCDSSSGCNSETKYDLTGTDTTTCYSCTDCSSSSSSSSYSSSTQKSSGCKYCKTLTTSSSLYNSVSRSCATSCTASDITISGVSTTTKCCTSYLCNDWYGDSSLTCYTSSYQKSSGCKYCKTVTTYSSLSSSTVDRSCATSCTASDYTLFGVRTKTDCCTSSLCNGATKNVSRNLFNLILPLCTLLLIVASNSILGEH